MKNMWFPEIRVCDALQRNSNNFDLLRLIAAGLVIFGHAYALSPKEGMVEPLLRFLKFDFSGGIAVSIFFFLSGVLVFDSYQRRPKIIVFLSSRVSRVMPGLLLCLLFSVFVIGPIFTQFSISDYLTNPSTFSYYSKNALLTNLQWRLPGVFESSHYGINGSLWSLPLEVRLYAAVALFGLVGAFRSRLVTIVILIALFLAGIFVPERIPFFLKDPVNVRPVAAFCFGMLLAANKQYLRIGPAMLMVVIVATGLAWDTPWRTYLFYPALYISLFYLFSHPALLGIKLPGDYSYGVYVYGFPIQQIVAHLQPMPHPWVNAALSLPLAVLFGAASWHFVEKRALVGAKGFMARLAGETWNWQEWVVRHRVSFRGAIILVIVFLPPLLAAWGPAPVQVYGERRIIEYGPKTVQAGQVFNRQPNGAAALWIRMDADIPADGAIVIGGIQMVSVLNGAIISAVVPAHIYASRRHLPLWVEYTDHSGARAKSSEVSFKVE